MVTKHFGFNPRICKRCDKVIGTFALGGSVSIHASVKDATAHSGTLPILYIVSIHASVKDATIIKDKEITEKIVSIHASVKDATNMSVALILSRGFQSTHL